MPGLSGDLFMALGLMSLLPISPSLSRPTHALANPFRRAPDPALGGGRQLGPSQDNSIIDHGRRHVKNAGLHRLTGSSPSPLARHVRSSVVWVEMPASLLSDTYLLAPSPQHPPLLALIPIPIDHLGIQQRDHRWPRVTQHQGGTIPASTSPQLPEGTACVLEVSV